MSNKIKISAVDLFCGAGGMTHGLLQAGIDVVAGVDIDEGCRYAYEHNNRPAKFLHADVADVDPDMLRQPGDKSLRLLVGSPPCQPFSVANRDKKQCDPRREMMLDFMRLAIKLLPDFVVMEEVPQAKNSWEYDRVKILLSSLPHDYKIWDGVVDCAQYGVPQSRRRLVMIASRHIPVKMIGWGGEPAATVADAIGDLPEIAAGETHAADRYHRSPRLSELNMLRMRASKPGGSWRTDWPAELMGDAHVRGSAVKSLYGRMLWDSPAPTITSQSCNYGSGRFGHPSQDRAISLREAALLQGFPRDYEFVHPDDRVTFDRVGRMIGNSVPPPLGRAIGESILAAVQSFVESAKK